MAKKLTIRKGCKARYVKTHYNMWGNPISTTNEVVTITDNPRDPETGRYCTANDWHAYVKVRNGEGREYEAECDDLEVYNTMGDLTHDDYMQLRREIKHGSIYLADYRNSFGIDENEVYSASEGFGMRRAGTTTRTRPKPSPTIATPSSTRRHDYLEQPGGWKLFKNSVKNYLSYGKRSEVPACDYGRD